MLKILKKKFWWYMNVYFAKIFNNTILKKTEKYGKRAAKQRVLRLLGNFCTYRRLLQHSCQPGTDM